MKRIFSSPYQPNSKPYFSTDTVLEPWVLLSEANYYKVGQRQLFIDWKNKCLSTQDKDSIDFSDLWTDEEVTQISKDLKDLPAKPWLDFSNWYSKEYKCDCGGKVAKTTCANWCTLKGGK